MLWEILSIGHWEKRKDYKTAWFQVCKARGRQCSNLTRHVHPGAFLSSVQSLSHVRLFPTPWTAARQAPLSITNTPSLLKLMAIKSVTPYNHLILCLPFSSCFQSFPASGSFPMNQFFASGGQRVGASASTLVLPMHIQDWFPLELTDWISLPSKGLSRVFSNTAVEKHQFFSIQFSS